MVESIEQLAGRPNTTPIRGRGIAAIARGIVCGTTPQVAEQTTSIVPRSVLLQVLEKHAGSRCIGPVVIGGLFS